VITGPGHGSVSVSSGGGFTYWASASYSGPVSFTYADTDAWGQVSNSATVTVTVTPVAQAMSAIDGGGSQSWISPRPLRPVAGPFIFALDSLPPSSDGSATINSSDRCGHASPRRRGSSAPFRAFAYEVIDGHGDTSAAASDQHPGQPTGSPGQ
jgi:hypothetical protein